jgi:peptidoglycan/LPS O-acetylase OafA/YrhL
MALILSNGDSTVVSKMKSLLNRPSLLFLGKISYSTYLIHYPILWLGKALVACIALHANPLLVALALFALTTPATLGVSVLLYHWVEKPGIDLGRRLFKNPDRERQDSQANTTDSPESSHSGSSSCSMASNM